LIIRHIQDLTKSQASQTTDNNRRDRESKDRRTW